MAVDILQSRSLGSGHVATDIPLLSLPRGWGNEMGLNRIYRPTTNVKARPSCMQMNSNQSASKRLRISDDAGSKLLE